MGERYESVRQRRERVEMGEEPGKFRAPNGTVPKKPVGVFEKVTAVIEKADRKLSELTGKKRK